ncbi:LPXTG cell wall anchor domain-containing protein [Candidatus Woesearchaeota archaeon]|nr:LPXTG cell wall anchor domain-containing protein [Candidatus Woesearchaeota archaeon]
MNKTNVGLAITFLGLASFIQAISLTETNQLVYLIIGIALILGGLFYASRKK